MIMEDTANYREFFEQHCAFEKLAKEIGNYYIKKSKIKHFVVEDHSYKNNHIVIKFANYYDYGDLYPKVLFVHVPVDRLRDWKVCIDELVLREKNEEEEKKLQKKERIKEYELRQLEALQAKYKDEL